MSLSYRYLSRLSLITLLLLRLSFSLTSWELQTRLEADALIQNRTLISVGK